MSTRTITITGRPPVRIAEVNWPLIASASDRDFDSQYEPQANQISKWFVGVRQHADGRAVVYATYSYDSNWQGARDHQARHGVLLPAGSDAAAICRAIRDVAEDMAAAEHDGEDAARWPTLAAECIADMPAETLAD